MEPSGVDKLGVAWLLCRSCGADVPALGPISGDFPGSPMAEMATAQLAATQPAAHADR